MVHQLLISRILISEEILSIFLNVAFNQNKSELCTWILWILALSTSLFIVLLNYLFFL